MPDAPNPEKWQTANRLSDSIVNLMNEATRAPGGFEPLELLAGQLLALCAFFQIAPPPDTLFPPVLKVLKAAAELALLELGAMNPDEPVAMEFSKYSPPEPLN